MFPPKISTNILAISVAIRESYYVSASQVLLLSSFLFLFCGFWKVAAAAVDTEVVGDDTPSIAGIGESHRANTAAGDNSSPGTLFQTGNCPLNPKPACEDPSCEGITGMGSNLAQYTCSNQRPVYLSEGSATAIIF